MSNMFRRASALCLLIVMALTAQAPAVVSAQSSQKPATSLTCDQQVGLVKYRSRLLVVYKQSQDSKYTAFRQQWVTRISYAGQWVPKDAANTRQSLYKYDALHAATDQELNKQIKSYKYLEKASLDCSSGKKVVGGNALINQAKQKETNFLKKDFKKSGDKLISKLHKQKAKQPKPTHPMLAVKSV